MLFGFVVCIFKRLIAHQGNKKNRVWFIPEKLYGKEMLVENRTESFFS
jgi:hypothetical protein